MVKSLQLFICPSYLQPNLLLDVYYCQSGSIRSKSPSRNQSQGEVHKITPSIINATTFIQEWVRGQTKAAYGFAGQRWGTSSPAGLHLKRHKVSRFAIVIRRFILDGDSHPKVKYVVLEIKKGRRDQ